MVGRGVLGFFWFCFVLKFYLTGRGVESWVCCVAFFVPRPCAPCSLNVSGPLPLLLDWAPPVWRPEGPFLLCPQCRMQLSGTRWDPVYGC